MGAMRKRRTSCLAGSVVIGLRGNAFKHRDLYWILEKSFYGKGDEALEQVAHKGGGCYIYGNVQGQAGRALSNVI